MKQNNAKTMVPFISPVLQNVVTGTQEFASNIRMNTQQAQSIIVAFTIDVKHDTYLGPPILDLFPYSGILYGVKTQQLTWK
jgi:hypothetical protein